MPIDPDDTRVVSDEVGADGAVPALAATATLVPPSPGRRRLHPLFRDLTLTVLAQAIVALGGLLLYRLLAVRTGTEGFASYSLVKQAVGVFFPVVTVGLVGGLPRYLALPRDRSSPSPEAYVAAAALICGAAAGLGAAIALAAPATTAEILFGDSERRDLVGPFVVLLVATTAFYVAYGYFRGLLRFRLASLLQVVGIGLSPSLVLLAFPGEPIDELILIMGVSLAFLSLIAVCVPLARSLVRARRRRIEPAGRALFVYGYRRVPGELAQLGLFVLVPVLAAHVTTLTNVAYISAGQQVLAVLSLAVLPIGLIVLPWLAKLWEQDRERARGYVGEITAFACHLALFVSLQAIVLADIGVEIWLGSSFEDAGSVVTVTVAPAALYALYLILRSTLDAVVVKSYNSRNNLIAFAVFAGFAALTLELELMRPVMCVAWSFAAGVTTQGLLTFATVHRLFAVDAAGYALHLAVPLTLTTGALAAAARPLIDGSPIALIMLLGIETLLAGAYFGLLFKARVPWTTMIRERLLEGH